MHHISTLTRERIMRTVSIFKNGNNRAIRLPAIWILRVSFVAVESVLSGRKTWMRSEYRPAPDWWQHKSQGLDEIVVDPASLFHRCSDGGEIVIHQGQPWLAAESVTHAIPLCRKQNNTLLYISKGNLSFETLPHEKS